MSPVKEYLKSMAVNAALLNMKGNYAASQRLYGTKGIIPALSSLPHSPMPGVSMTREAVLNYLQGKGFRPYSQLESIGEAADMVSSKLPKPVLEKIKSLTGYSTPTINQRRLANSAAAIDTALSLVPLVGDAARPSRFLEHKQLYGTPLTNLIPMYTAHREIARPIFEREILKKSLDNKEISKLEKALLTRMLK